MEKTNAINNAAVINENTTLGELISFLGNIEKADKTPTPKKLREEAGEPVAREERTLVYANGYAVYDNGTGRTVIWVPDCTRFTYHFNPLRDSEKDGDIKENEELPADFLESLPWAIAITLVGDHRVEDNIMNRAGSRTGTKDYSSHDNRDHDDQAEKATDDSYRNEYNWREDRFGEDPESIVIRKETRKEALDSMTEKQREVFLLYYHYGYTQQEIAEKLYMTQIGVKHHLDGAIKKVEKVLRG